MFERCKIESPVASTASTSVVGTFHSGTDVLGGLTFVAPHLHVRSFITAIMPKTGRCPASVVLRLGAFLGPVGFVLGGVSERRPWKWCCAWLATLRTERARFRVCPCVP